MDRERKQKSGSGKFEILVHVSDVHVEGTQISQAQMTFVFSIERQSLKIFKMRIALCGSESSLQLNPGRIFLDKIPSSVGAFLSFTL